MGLKVGDKVIFINNNPRFRSDHILRGKVGCIINISSDDVGEDDCQSLCIDWDISNRKHWWTFRTNVRLAKPEELS